MSFTIFKNKDSTSSEDMNNNYKYLGQNLLPKSGASMTVNTSKTYNIGSADYRWSIIHVDKLHSINKVINDSFTIEKDTMTSAKNYYNVYGHISDVTIGTYYFTINNDSSATDYNYENMTYNTYEGSTPGFIIREISSTIGSGLNNVMFNGNISKLVNGKISFLFNSYFLSDNTCTLSHVIYSGVYNQTDTITSISANTTSNNFYKYIQV